MSRGRAFVTLDMPEAGICAMALQYELRALRQMAARQQIAPDLQDALDSSEALFRRLAKRLKSAGIEVKL